MKDRMTRIGMALGVALLTVGVGAGVFAVAQGPGGPGGPFGRGGFGGPGGRMGGPGRGGPMAGLPLQQLNLTSSQKEQVQSIMQSHEADFRSLGERGRAAHEALRAASTSGSFDEGLVRTKAADVANVESDMAVLNARIYSEIFQILTTEQKAKAKELQAQRPERRDRKPQ
jgi:periplasmic protein CpxP/Spy